LQEQFEDFNDFDIDGGTDSETRYGTYCALQKRSAAKKTNLVVAGVCIHPKRMQKMDK